MPLHCQQQSHDEIRHRGTVGAGGIDDHDPGLSGRRDIYVVHSHAVLGDDLQVGCGSDHRGVHIARATISASALPTSACNSAELKYLATGRRVVCRPLSNWPGLWTTGRNSAREEYLSHHDQPTEMQRAREGHRQRSDTIVLRMNIVQKRLDLR